MTSPLFRRIYIPIAIAIVVSAAPAAGLWFPVDDGLGDRPRLQLGSYEGIPSTDANDGKFLLIAGSGHATLHGTKVVAYVGVLAGESTFEVGIFDGDVGGYWDFSSPSSTSFTIHMDPLKNGTTAFFVKSWTSTVCPDDNWYTETFSVDSKAQAPSGNYFYRLTVEWLGGTPTTGLNNFKIRTTAQVSLAPGSGIGFSGGPQAAIDPDFGTPDNTYDGKWCYNFYIPRKTSRVVFRDGDADIIYDTDDPNTPPPEGDRDGEPPDDNPDSKYRISPNIHMVVTDPDGNEYRNVNPSGNTEWEIFSIGNLADDDHYVNYTLSAGLWQYEVRGMDAHNANFLETTYEVFVCGGKPPLPINPPPEVEPDYDVEEMGGAMYHYSHTITNRGLTQAYDLLVDSALGWPVELREDTNENGVYDMGEPEVDETPSLDPDDAYYVLVGVDVPSGPLGTTDTVELTALSQIEWAVQDSALDGIKIGNLPPIPDAGGPYVADEGDVVTFDASGSYDPDGDPLEYMWDVDDDGVFETGYSSSPFYDFIFGDDFDGKARVRVTDGTHEVEDAANVTINNVAPSIDSFLDPWALIDMTFRIAGEKYHDVEFFVYEDRTEIGYAYIVRYPGGPDDQAVTLYDVNISLLNRYSVLALYTPLDDPINGEIWGSDPAWVILDFHDGNETIIHHTFNIRHQETWRWRIDDLNQYFAGHNFTFQASASDPGSDDLTFSWDWGDGGSESRMYYNDGMGPDPYPSYDVNPIAVTDTTVHAFSAPGNYEVMLEVTDDDGGSTSVSFTILSKWPTPPIPGISVWVSESDA